MSPDPPLEAATLDVWYTLLYQTAGDRVAYEAARQRAWVDPLTEAGVPVEVAGTAYDRLVERARALEGAGRAWTLSEQQRWLARATGLRVPLDAVRRSLVRAAEQAEVRLAPGVLPALDRLADQGITLGLVSNVLYEPPEAIRGLLRREGLLRRVDAVVLSSEIGAAKPSSRPIRAALKELGVSADRTIHIGDQAGDIEAAWGAGVAALRYIGVRDCWPSTHTRRLPPAFRAAPNLSGWAELAERRGQYWNRSRRAIPVGPKRHRRTTRPRR